MVCRYEAGIDFKDVLNDCKLADSVYVKFLHREKEIAFDAGVDLGEIFEVMRVKRAALERFLEAWPESHMKSDFPKEAAKKMRKK